MAMKEFRNKIKMNLMPELKEQPLQYWEKNSIMILIPFDYDENTESEFPNRISAIPGLVIDEMKEPSDDMPGKMKITYDGVQYNLGYIAEEYQPSEGFMHQQNLNEAEQHALDNAKKSFSVFMQFEGEPQKAYHLQLKICMAAVPDAAVILDESQERIFSGRWARLAAKSSVVPAQSALYTVQAVSAENGEVWLHTHGLARFGITELEIVGSDRENANNHFQIIKALAGRLIMGDEGDINKGVYYIGLIGDEIPVVVTYASWTKGVREYEKLALGGEADRDKGHNTKTSLIFVYRNPTDEQAHILSKVNIYDGQWDDTAMFFLSEKETRRMEKLARERFGFVRNAAKDSSNKIIVKLGLETDEKYRKEDGGTDKEHIWFDITGFEGDKFRAVLTQEPYYIDDLHEGFEGLYSVDDVTDWIIVTPDSGITPDDVYILIDT